MKLYHPLLSMLVIACCLCSAYGTQAFAASMNSGRGYGLPSATGAPPIGGMHNSPHFQKGPNISPHNQQGPNNSPHNTFKPQEKPLPYPANEYPYSNIMTEPAKNSKAR